MIAKNFQGYIEGKDITMIDVVNLAYPSKDVLVTKGKVITRGGLVNDGTLKSVDEAIHSEFTWTDSLGGVRPIRVHGQTVQVKYNSKWYTIFTGLGTDTIRVFFATWVDGNTTIIKKRLIFCDGTPNLYSWNGAIAVVDTADANTINIAGVDTCLQLGFDDGSTTNQTLLHFIGSATTANSEELQTNNPSAAALEISGTFNTTPVAGDVVIAKPVTFSNEISSAFNIDVIYSYKNHIICANYNRVHLYWSHVSTYSLATGLDFTQPVAASRTALTAIFMQLDGNFTAMISRQNVLWVSDANDWYKITKSIEQNAYDLWVDVEKFETGERKGALPMAVAKHKGDIIYMGQDKSLQRVTTVEITGRDDIKTLSDDVEDLFARLDMDDIRLYYVERAIYIICPQDSTLVILDMIEGYFQPPQTMPINCMSVIEGIKYGHHNAENSTYELFSGKTDLGTPVQGIIAFAYQSGQHEYKYKKNTLFGVNCRINLDTIVTVQEFFEEEGAKASPSWAINGATVKKLSVDDDVSWATHPYATRSIGGADMVVTDLKRAMVFSKNNALGYFDFRPIFTISGDENEFHLLSWYIDEQISDRKVGNDMFVAK